MSLARDISRKEESRQRALRSAFDITKLERDAMAASYAKSGAQVAGNVNLQQYDWKLDRLAAELREQGVSVEWPVVPQPVSTTLTLKRK